MSKLYSEIRTDYVHGYLVEGCSLESCDGHMVTVSVDGWPMPEDPENPTEDDEQGSVLLEVIATEHGDIVLAWHDNGARGDADVKEAIKDCKKTIREIAEGAKEEYPEFYQGVMKHV